MKSTSLLTSMIAAVAILLISGCGDKKEKVLDRTDPEATAAAVMKAYKAKDMAALAALSSNTNQRIFAELAEQGEAHGRYESIFKGWRWEAVEGWDGKTEGARYNGNKAAVVVGDIPDAPGSEEDEIVVVVLAWEDEQWAFDDINSPSRSRLESAYSATRGE